MLSKEEKLIYSLSALNEVIKTFEIDVNVTLTKNNYEYTINAYKEIERFVVDYVNSLQPYEFEDLKVGMWVWDNKYDMWNRILEIRINCAKEQEIEFDYSLENDEEIYNDIYEDNRFYPVQIANVGCE